MEQGLGSGSGAGRATLAARVRRRLGETRRLAIVGLLVALLALAACQGDDEQAQAQPDIQILDGTTVLTAASVVDFGSQSQFSPVSKTFTLANVGQADLTVTLPVAVAGADTSFYTVSTPPATSVSAGGTTTFIVDFPTDLAFTVTKTATITVTSNDPDAGSFTFGVTGVANS